MIASVSEQINYILFPVINFSYYLIFVNSLLGTDDRRETKLYQQMVIPDARKYFRTMRVIKRLKRFPKEAADASCLSAFKRP